MSSTITPSNSATPQRRQWVYGLEAWDYFPATLNQAEYLDDDGTLKTGLTRDQIKTLEDALPALESFSATKKKAGATVTPEDGPAWKSKAFAMFSRGGNAAKAAKTRIQEIAESEPSKNFRKTVRERAKSGIKAGKSAVKSAAESLKDLGQDDSTIASTETKSSFLVRTCFVPTKSLS